MCCSSITDFVIQVGLILVSDSANQALVTHTGECNTCRVCLLAEHHIIVYTYLVTDFGLTGNIIWSLPVSINHIRTWFSFQC
jgi:hypothetical protein